MRRKEQNCMYDDYYYNSLDYVHYSFEYSEYVDADSIDTVF